MSTYDISQHAFVEPHFFGIPRSILYLAILVFFLLILLVRVVSYLRRRAFHVNGPFDEFCESVKKN